MEEIKKHKGFLISRVFHETQKKALHEKCSYSEFILVRIFPYAGKCGPE